MDFNYIYKERHRIMVFFFSCSGVGKYLILSYYVDSRESLCRAVMGLFWKEQNIGHYPKTSRPAFMQDWEILSCWGLLHLLLAISVDLLKAAY